MYCPKCGQERTSDATNFCSRCGYLLTGTAELLLAGGIIPTRSSGAQSPRSRGVKQGLFILLLSFLVVPLVALFSVWVHAPAFFVAASAVSLFVGGLLRMAYAALFESTLAGLPTLEEHALVSAGGLINSRQMGLPASTTIPISAYAAPGTGKWRDTNELQPTSVTENTTKLLESDQ